MVICHFGGVVRREAKQGWSEERMRLQVKLTLSWEMIFSQTHSTNSKDSILLKKKKRYSQEISIEFGIFEFIL